MQTAEKMNNCGTEDLTNWLYIIMGFTIQEEMQGMCTDEYLMLAVIYVDNMRNSVNGSGVDNYDILNKTPQNWL